MQFILNIFQYIQNNIFNVRALYRNHTLYISKKRKHNWTEYSHKGFPSLHVHVYIFLTAHDETNDGNPGPPARFESSDHGSVDLPCCHWWEIIFRIIHNIKLCCQYNFVLFLSDMFQLMCLWFHDVLDNVLTLRMQCDHGAKICLHSLWQYSKT